MTSRMWFLGAGACALIVVVILTVASLGPDDQPTSGSSGTPAPAKLPTTSAPPDSDSSTTAENLPADLLLPNMRSLAPTDLQVVNEEGERRLRFAGLLANVGDGPMLVRPRGSESCPPNQRPAQQVIYRDRAGDGAFQRARDPIGLRRSTGCRLDHAGHDHWHFDAMARYTLRETDGTVTTPPTSTASTCPCPGAPGRPRCACA